MLPPFWRTWWFLSLTTVCLLGMIVGSVHYVSTQRLQRQLAALRQKEALEKERARIARDIHDQVGASLTQVSLLGELVESDKDQPEEVEAHARQIEQTALETTRALDEIVWTVNPSNDTLDGLITYVCKYAQDYLAVAGLRYRLEVPPQLPGTPISPEVRHNVFLAAKESDHQRGAARAGHGGRDPPAARSRAGSRWRSRTTGGAWRAWIRRRRRPEMGCATCANGWRISAAVSRWARRRKRGTVVRLTAPC